MSEKVVYLNQSCGCTAVLPSVALFLMVFTTFLSGFSLHKPLSPFVYGSIMLQPRLPLSQVKGSVSPALLPVHLTCKKEEGGGILGEWQQGNSLLFEKQ